VGVVRGLFRSPATQQSECEGDIDAGGQGDEWRAMVRYTAGVGMTYLQWRSDAEVRSTRG
jgi:hypothetical protein